MLLHPYTLFAVLALAVWLPDGFNIGPVSDGWVEIREILRGTAVLQPSLARAFLTVPFHLGLSITPDSFRGLQWVLFVLTVLRAMLFYEVIKRAVPGNRSFALCCGLLAMFHPADRSFFIVDWVNVGFAYVAALAACLFAVLYLDRPRRWMLLAMAMFQMLTGFTYPAFIVLALALPAGVWLLRRCSADPRPAIYLLKVSLAPLLIAVAILLVASFGGGREGRMMQWAGLMSGYASQLAYFIQATLGILQFPGLRPWWAGCALGAAAFAWAVAWPEAKAAVSAGASRRSPRYLVVLAAGLVLLAVLAYAPYSISDVRQEHMRQMLAAGTFLYAALLVPACFTSSKLRFIAVGIVAALVTVSGFTDREVWVDSYRNHESLLSAVATALPQPPDGTVVVVRTGNGPQFQLLKRRLNGFSAAVYANLGTFNAALRWMYGFNKTVYRGGFIGDPQTDRHTISGFLVGPGESRLTAGDGGVWLRQARDADADESGYFVRYRDLLVLDYSLAGTKVVEADELAQQLGSKQALDGYRPDAMVAYRGPTSATHPIVCSLLETTYRPAYCPGR